MPFDNFILGHEVAGQVVKVGSQVKGIRIGERYVVHSANSCGACEMCLSNHNNLCIANNYKSFGYGVDGGFQQYIVVKTLGSLVRIPENVSYAVAAVTSDAVLTPYHAVKKAKITPTSKVLLIGAGGLGSNAIQLIKLFSAHLVVVDKKESLRQFCLDMGATEFYTDITKQTEHKPSSFDLCLDFVAVQETFSACQAYVKHCGYIMPVGMGSITLSFDLLFMNSKEVLILGNIYGTTRELEECLTLVSKKLVTPQVTVHDFEELRERANQLLHGDCVARMAFNPNQPKSKL